MRQLTQEDIAGLKNKCLAEGRYGYWDAVFYLIAERDVATRKIGELESVLAELVFLKDVLKEERPDEYEQRKPGAWEAARQAVAKRGMV